MEMIPVIILVVLGVPAALAIWLIVRAVQAGARIEELSFRLSELETEVIRLKRERESAKPAEPAPTPMPVPQVKTAAPSPATHTGSHTGCGSRITRRRNCPGCLGHPDGCTGRSSQTGTGTKTGFHAAKPGANSSKTARRLARRGPAAEPAATPAFASGQSQAAAPSPAIPAATPPVPPRLPPIEPERSATTAAPSRACHQLGTVPGCKGFCLCGGAGILSRHRIRNQVFL